MARPRVRWATWFAGLAAVAAVAGGLWYAHGRGWLASVEERVHRSAERSRVDRPEGDSMGGMPGMEMGGMEEVGAAPRVKGYAEVEVAADVQQRIGVTVGEVERAPLQMSVRTVGIVRPDETKTFHIHVRTEGWVEKQFVNYTGQKVGKGEPFLSIYSPEFYRTQLDYMTARRERAREHLGSCESARSPT